MSQAQPIHLRATGKVVSVTEQEELKTRGFCVIATLGEGSYAKVKSAISTKWNRKVALKIIDKRKAPKDFLNKFLPRELDILRNINHPNIVMLFEIMNFNAKVYLVMELAGHGDLLEYIKLRGALTEEKARSMFYQLCSAIDYLHSMNIIHRDLKCENILLDAQNNLKVSDFGFCRELAPTETSKTFCGSAAYAPPEILQGIPYSGTSYDIWSMGVIFYIMVCGSMPYDDSNIKKMIKIQVEKKVQFSKNRKLSDEAKHLCHCMLEVDIGKRITVQGILHHPWMKNYISTLQCAMDALWKAQKEIMDSINAERAHAPLHLSQLAVASVDPARPTTTPRSVHPTQRPELVRPCLVSAGIQTSRENTIDTQCTCKCACKMHNKPIPRAPK